MMVWLIVILAVVLIAVYSYAQAMYDTTLRLGLMLWDDFKAEMPPNPPIRIQLRGLQDELTPRAQNVWIQVQWGLMIVVFGLTTYFSAWYHGLWVLVVTMLIGLSVKFVLCRCVWTPDDPRMIVVIRADMLRRQNEWLAAGDDRARYWGTTIRRFDALTERLGLRKQPAPIPWGRMLVEFLLSPVILVMALPNIMVVYARAVIAVIQSPGRLLGWLRLQRDELVEMRRARQKRRDLGL